MVDFFTPGQIDHLSGSIVRCDFLATFDFASGVKRAWNGNTELVIAGNAYQPMFGYGVIDGLGLSGQGTTSEAITLSLPGIASDRLDFLQAAIADTDEVQQRMVTIALQLFDEDWQPIGVPIPLFRGFMQPPKVTRSTMEDAEGAIQSISISAENIFYGRARPPNGRNTDRDQQARSPGDKFFGFVASLVYKIIRYPDY